MVGPHVGAPQWFADPLAVCVLAAALGTAHALVVQQVHAAHVAHLAHLALQAPLRRDGDRQYHCGDAWLKLREESCAKQLKEKFLTDGMRGGLVVRCVFCCQIFSSSLLRLLFTPVSGWQERLAARGGLERRQDE